MATRSRRSAKPMRNGAPGSSCSRDSRRSPTRSSPSRRVLPATISSLFILLSVIARGMRFFLVGVPAQPLRRRGARDHREAAGLLGHDQCGGAGRRRHPCGVPILNSTAVPGSAPPQFPPKAVLKSPLDHMREQGDGLRNGSSRRPAPLGRPAAQNAKHRHFRHRGRAAHRGGCRCAGSRRRAEPPDDAAAPAAAPSLAG